MDIVINRRGTSITIKDVEHDDIPGMVEEVLLKVDTVQDKREHNKREDYTKQFMNGFYGKANTDRIRDSVRDSYNEYREITKLIESIVLPDRCTAEQLIEFLENDIYEYGLTSVDRVFEYFELPCPDNAVKWGWNNVQGYNTWAETRKGEFKGWHIYIPGLKRLD